MILPFRALFWVFEEVANQAERALYDEDGLRRMLADLYRQLESGLISEDLFNEREAELARLLAEAEEYNRTRGH